VSVRFRRKVETSTERTAHEPSNIARFGCEIWT
jgi:hypothetical protein